MTCRTRCARFLAKLWAPVTCVLFRPPLLLASTLVTPTASLLGAVMSCVVESANVSKINWFRVLGCGLLAGVVWIVLGSIVTALLGRDFAALPRNHLGAPTLGFVLFNAVLDLLEGISILWLYASIRATYGASGKTAIIAAFAWWFIVSLGDATWCSFGFFPPRTVIPLMIGTLPALVIATLAGAKLYTT